MSYTIYYHICLRSEERSAMNISQIAEAEKKRLLKEKKRLEKLLCEAPEGKLVYSTSRSKGRSYYKWFVSLVRAGKKVLVSTPALGSLLTEEELELVPDLPKSWSNGRKRTTSTTRNTRNG